MWLTRVYFDFYLLKDQKKYWALLKEMIGILGADYYNYKIKNYIYKLGQNGK